MNIKRNQNLDLLKLIACIMVIIIHVSATFVTSSFETMNSKYYVGHFFDSFSRVCVPIFIMITGSFVLNNQSSSQRESWQLNTQKTWQAIIPTVIWSGVYLAYGFIINILTGASITASFVVVVKSLVLGKPFYHLWYMYMIIGVYLSIPILLKIKQKISFRMFVIATIAMITVGYMLSLANNIFPFSIINKVQWLKSVQYIGYFMLGNVLITWFNKSTIKKSLFVGIGATIFVISSLTIFLLTNIDVANGNTDLYWYGNLSPFVITASIGLFTAVANLQVSFKRINVVKLASYTFTIYLVHALILDVINKMILVVGKLLGTELIFNPVWYIPVMVIIIFTLSMIFATSLDTILKKVKSKKQIKTIREVFSN